MSKLRDVLRRRLDRLEMFHDGRSNRLRRCMARAAMLGGVDTAGPAVEGENVDEGSTDVEREPVTRVPCSVVTCHDVGGLAG